MNKTDLNFNWRKSFVGREQELEVFKKVIASDSENRILWFSGIGGVGKSFLQERFRIESSANGVIYVKSDHLQNSIEDVINHFARILEDNAIPLSKFKNLSKKIDEIRFKILKDHDENKPEYLSQIVSTGITEVSSILSKFDLTTNAIMQAGGKSLVKEASFSITNYLFRKFTKDEIDILKDANYKLLSALFSDIKSNKQKLKIVFGFDTYESTQPILDQWLVNSFVPDALELENTFMVFTGREKYSDIWSFFSPVLFYSELISFDAKEIEEYLKKYSLQGQLDPEKLLEETGGLPLLLHWIPGSGESFDLSIIANRFLNNVDDPDKKTSIYRCALPRRFNLEIIKNVLEGIHIDDVESFFDELINLPGITKRNHFWEFHEIIRSSIVEHIKDSSPTEFVKINKELIWYFENLFEIYKEIDDSFKTSQKARLIEIDRIYHQILISEVKGVQTITKHFISALVVWDESIMTEIEKIAKEIHLSAKSRSHIKSLVQTRYDFESKKFSLCIPAFEYFIREYELSSIENGILYRTIAKMHGSNNHHVECIQYYQKSIDLEPSNIKSYQDLAEAYKKVGDFNQAINTYYKIQEINADLEASCLLKIGEIQIENSMFDAFEETQSKISTKYPNTIEEYNLKLLRAKQEKSINVQVSLHEEVANNFPELKIQALFNIGIIHLNVGNLDHLKEVGALLVEEDNERYEGHLIRYLYHNSIQDRSKEIESLSSLALTNSEVGLSIFKEQIVKRFVNGDFEYPFQLLEKISEDNTNEEVAFGLSLSFRLLGMHEMVSSTWKRILKRNPSSLLAICNLADSYMDVKDYDSALIHFENALLIDPGNKSVIDPLSLCYEKIGRLTDANNLKSISITSNHPQFHFNEIINGFVHLPFELDDENQFVNLTLDEIFESKSEIFEALAIVFVSGRIDLFFEFVIFPHRNLLDSESYLKFEHNTKEFIKNVPINEKIKLLNCSIETSFQFNWKKGLHDLDSFSARNYLILGERYWQIGHNALVRNELDISQKFFQRGFDLFPEFNALSLDYMVHQIRQGDTENAKLYLMSVCNRLSNESSQSKFEKIYNYLLNNQFIDGVEFLFEQTELDFDRTHAIMHFVRTLIKLGKMNLAEKYLKSLISSEPNYITPYNQLIVIFWRAKETDKLDELISNIKASPMVRENVLGAIESIDDSDLKKFLNSNLVIS